MVENIVASVLMTAAAIAGVWVLWRKSSGKKPKELEKQEHTENVK